MIQINMITTKQLSIYLIYVIGAILILFKITKLYFWYVFEQEQLSGKIRINVAFYANCSNMSSENVYTVFNIYYVSNVYTEYVYYVYNCLIMYQFSCKFPRISGDLSPQIL